MLKKALFGLVFVCCVFGRKSVKFMKNSFDIGYPFHYYIPSTRFDVEIQDPIELEFRRELIQVLFASNYGGATVDNWVAKTGSYISLETGQLINEKIAIAEVYITEQNWNETKDEILAQLVTINCNLFEQESFLVSYDNDGDIIVCTNQNDIIDRINLKWKICSMDIPKCNNDTILEKNRKPRVQLFGVYFNDMYYNKSYSKNVWNQCTNVWFQNRYQMYDYLVVYTQYNNT